MKNEAAVEEARRVSSTGGVSGRSVISTDVLLAIIIGLLIGVFVMLDSEFDRLHAQHQAIDRRFDALHGQFKTLATKEDLREVKEDVREVKEDVREVKEDVRELDNRLVRIEEYLGIGAGSGSPRE